LNRKKIETKRNLIHINNNCVIREYPYPEYLQLFENCKLYYEKIKNNKYVPNFEFFENKIIQTYCGKTLKDQNLNIETKDLIKIQIIDFINLIFNEKIAHRDFHIKNICWDGSQIWVIDWEFIIKHEPNNILKHYDVTGVGLPSPFLSGNMNVFKNHKLSVVNWLKPIKLEIEELLI